MRRLSKIAALVVLAVTLSGCSFLDNIICSLIALPSCGSDGNADGLSAVPGGGMDSRIRQATHIGEAHGH